MCIILRVFFYKISINDQKMRKKPCLASPIPNPFLGKFRVHKSIARDAYNATLEMKTL